MNKVNIKVRLKYRNVNTLYKYIGCHYRLLNEHDGVIAKGYTDSEGLTKNITVSKNSKVYIECLCLDGSILGNWESTNPLGRNYFTAKSSTTYETEVKNSYFRIKVSNFENKPGNLYYKMTFKDEQGNSIIKDGYTGYNGQSKIYKPEVFKKPRERLIFENMCLSGNNKVKVEIFHATTKKHISTKWHRLIPVGADKFYREHKVSVSFFKLEPTKDSLNTIRHLGDYRRIIMDISITKGATYEVIRGDKGKLIDDSLSLVKKIAFQDSTKTEIRVPIKYTGDLYLKKGSKIIATLPLDRLDVKNEKNLLFFV